VTLLQQARMHWPFYITTWVYFPVLLIAVRYGGVSLTAWFWPVVAFSLIAGLGPCVPSLRRQVGYWHGMALAVGVPVAVLLLSLLAAATYDAA
jgi:hypothetical protein